MPVRIVEPYAPAPKVRIVEQYQEPEKPRVPVLSDVIEAMKGAGHEVAQDYRRETTRKAPASVREFADQFVDDTFRKPGHLISAALSPLTGLTEGAIVQPGAALMDRIPLKAYANDGKALDDAGKHDANIDIIRTALMGARGVPMKAGVAAESAAAIPRKPMAATKAETYARRVAKSARATPEALAAASPDITAAEALGQSGKTALGALARREGTTGDVLQAAIAARRAGRPQRVLDSFAGASGIDPATVADVGGASARAITEAAQVPEVASGSAGHAVHTRLNGEFDAAKAHVNNLYDAAREARPDGAQLIGEAKPAFGQSLREAMAEFDPQDVPRVARQIDGFDSLKTATARDLFEMRARVGKLRASADPVEGEAASTLVKALDSAMDQGLESGAFTGDPSVVAQWREAVAARRQMGKEFEGKDLIHALTKRVYRGGERTNAVAGEDASNAIFGRSGVTAKPNAVRDLTRLRDRLGAKSPEWGAVQGEALSRVVGKEAGSERFGQSWDRFATQSPELANLLLAPEAQARLTTSRAAIGDATRAREAFSSGEGDVFNASVSARHVRERLAGLPEADRTSIRAGVASRLYDQAQSGRFDPKALTAPHVQDKLKALFGDEGAAMIVGAAQREAEMAGFEGRYGPQTNSVTSDIGAAIADQDGGGALRDVIADLVGNAHHGPIKAASAAAAKAAGRGVAVLRTPGMSIPVRDEAGRLLMMKPQEFAEFLKTEPSKASKIPAGVPRRIAGAARVAVPLLQTSEAREARRTASR